MEKSMIDRDIIDVQPRMELSEAQHPVRAMSSGELMRWLCPSPEEALRLLPQRVVSDHDPAGLVKHESVHDAIAKKIFHGFSFVCASIAKHDGTVRSALISDGATEFPAERFDRIHSFSVQHSVDHETGRTSYEFFRADGGNDDGGFFVTKGSDDAIIITRDLEAPHPENGSYAQLLLLAERSLIAYADFSGISSKVLYDNENTDHLTLEHIREIADQDKYEQTVRARSARAAKKLGRQVATRASRLITTEDTDAPIPGVRKYSKMRIAALALVLPIPGYSSNIGDSSIPRPASIELAADALGAFRDAWPDPAPAKLDPTVAYDERALDLPGSADVTIGESGQAVPVLQEVPQIPSDIPVVSSSYNTPLAAGSPRVVEIDEPLAPQSCVRLPLASSAQNQPLSFAAADSRVAGQFELDVEPEAIYVCNVSGDLVTDARFYFDVTK
jgi:hypothetical protein